MDNEDTEEIKRLEAEVSRLRALAVELFREAKSAVSIAEYEIHAAHYGTCYYGKRMMDLQPVRAIIARAEKEST